MDNAGDLTIQVQHCIDRLRRGDQSAREELLNAACQRLEHLTRKVKRDFPQLGRWEQTEDVAQNAALRLYRSLAETELNDAAHFFRLAALQIRRELIDLARRYQGAHGLAAMHQTQAAGNQQDQADDMLDRGEQTYDPRNMAEWAEFHERISELTEEQREVFDLLWYNGLSQQDAAQLLNVDVRTIKRRWRAARLALHETLGELPGA